MLSRILLSALLFVLAGHSASAQWLNRVQSLAPSGSAFLTGLGSNGAFTTFSLGAGAMAALGNAANGPGGVLTDAIFGRANAWAGNQSFSASIFANATGIPSVDISPGGLGFEPFGSTRAYNYFNLTVPNGAHSFLGAATAITATAYGSGAFGPGTSDAATLLSIQKTNWLSSTVEGELDTVWCLARQGIKGDVSCLLADIQKVRNAVNGTGGPLGTEMTVAWVDNTGADLYRVHSILAFQENWTGISGGTGYGLYTEAVAGVNFAAFFGGVAYEGAPAPAAGFNYLMLGANSRALAGLYYRVVGDTPPAGYIAGDIVQGYTGSTKVLRTSGGVFQIVNDALTTQLFTLTDAGVAAFPNQLIVGALPNPTCNGPLCVRAAGNQNIDIWANVNSGPAIEALNDLSNAWSPLSLVGSQVYIQTNGVNAVSIDSSQVATFMNYIRINASLTTGAKAQARYFPININGTAVNVLTD